MSLHLNNMSNYIQDVEAALSHCAGSIKVEVNVESK